MSLIKMFWYFLRMRIKGRIITLDKGKGLLTYFVTDSIKKCYKRPFWSIVKEDLSGRYIYLDKMFSRGGMKFKKEKVWHYLKSRFPQIELVCWFRGDGVHPDKFYRYTYLKEAHSG